jgi:hypothetical protein
MLNAQILTKKLMNLLKTKLLVREIKSRELICGNQELHLVLPFILISLRSLLQEVQLTSKRLPNTVKDTLLNRICGRDFLN